MVVTFPLPQTIRAPMGAKIMPMRNNVGKTAFGVRMAGSGFTGGFQTVKCKNPADDKPKVKKPKAMNSDRTIHISQAAVMRRKKAAPKRCVI